MHVLNRKILCAYITALCCVAPYNNAFAVLISSPPAVAPVTIEDGDNLNVISGTLATTDSTAYTVKYDPNTTTQLTEVYPGATVSYKGSNTAASTFSSQLNDVTTGLQNIDNYGIINRGSGQYAINLTNVNAGAQNIAIIRNFDKATIIGDILFTGRSIVTEINGHPAIPGTSQVQGNFTFTTDPAGQGIFFVGANQPNSSYITGGTITSITDATDIYVVSSSTMTANHDLINIKRLQIQAGSTFNLNRPITGSMVALDNLIDVQGPFNVAADILKTGGLVFYGNSPNNGQVRIKEIVNIDLATYDSVTNTGLHISEFTDLYHYGRANFSTASPDFDKFKVEYTGGYFPGGTYTLVQAPSIGTLPNSYSGPISTMFLTFGTPINVPANELKLPITRTGFQDYASTPFTKYIGESVEYVGSHNPPQSFMPILNALERSTTIEQVTNGLRQLAPIISAPLYSFMLQDKLYEQVHLRIANRKQNSYSSGDEYSDYSTWVRGLYDKAKQSSTGDCAGYYATTGGGFIGADKQMDRNFVLGGTFVYAHSKVNDQINSNSYTDIKSYQFMLYGSHDYQPWYATWVVDLGFNDYDANRNIDINHAIFNAAGKYKNTQAGAKILIGSYFRPIDYLQVSPEVSALYSFASSYSYMETGGSANLQVLSNTSNFVQTAAVLKLESPLMVRSMVLIPEVRIKALYNPVNGSQYMNAGFLDGGPQFLSSAGLSRTGAAYGASLTMDLRDHLEFKFNYEHTSIGGYHDDAYYVNIRYVL